MDFQELGIISNKGTYASLREQEKANLSKRMAIDGLRSHSLPGNHTFPLITHKI